MPPQEEQIYSSFEQQEQPTTITMKPQHEQQQLPADDLECFINSSSCKLTAPGFSLGAWGDTGAAPKEELPFAFPESRDVSWDDDDDDDDDDDSKSCEWSVASADSSIYWDAEDEEDETLSAELDEYLALQTTTTTRVRFCTDLVSDVRHFIKPSHEDCKNMYYTAHELQHMIDDFVRAGGTSLLSPA